MFLKSSGAFEGQHNNGSYGVVRATNKGAEHPTPPNKGFIISETFAALRCATFASQETQFSGASPTPSISFKMSLNGPVTESFPSPGNPKSATVSFSQHGWTISTRKLPISKSDAIDDMSDKLGIPVPEMIFGDNMVSVENAGKGWCLEFNSFDALDRVDKTDKTMLKVAYSREWSESREKTHETIKEVVKPFDWSYSTDYKGTIGGASPIPFTPDTEPIPIELLKRPDPILHFEEVVLYESELDDNGISLYSIKLRVMPERMLILARNFMRLDNVLIRIRDTRVYIDFKSNKVTREYTATEEKFDAVKEALLKSRLPDDVIVAMRDPNQMASYLKKVDHTLESVKLS
ncbi:hypothetical protein V492_04471 [Pseudogymnoascus sp. VKM F-4246]|nr:hypothetical protein V492_04471 [Pseudogymnoascus sp. VKM F-4246]